MEKIRFKDGTELEIKEGARLGSIVTVAADFAELGTAADALTKQSNLDNVQFKTDNAVTGEYAGMKLESPLFRTVDVAEGKVLAAFSIRKKTEMELAIEELRAGQQVQDGALADLGTVVSELSEGGTK